MNNGVNFPTVIRKRVNVKSFSGGYFKGGNSKLSGVENCELSYNFNYFDGTLRRGATVTQYNVFNNNIIFGGSVQNIYFYPYYDHENDCRDDRVLVYASDGYLYSSPMGGDFMVHSEYKFKSAPNAISYNYLDNDVMLISHEEDGLFILSKNTLTKVEGAPAITSLCIHNERLFVTVAGKGTSLWFSDDFDPTNWSISLEEAGFIDFSNSNGKLLRVVSFLGSVYVFAEHGISRVTAYADQTEFTVDNLFCSQGKIYGNSVTVCGDFIVLLTTSGFFKFNGIDTVKILGEYDTMLGDIQNSNVKGVFRGTELYFKVRLYVANRINDVVLVYDVIKNNSYLMLNFGVLDMCFAGGRMNGVWATSSRFGISVCLISPNIYQTKVEKYWKSPPFDLGIKGKNKRLTRLSLYTKTEVTLTVTADNKKLVYNLKGGGQEVVKPALKGEYFTFELLTTNKDPEIYDLNIDVEYVKEGDYVY